MKQGKNAKLAKSVAKNARNNVGGQAATQPSAKKIAGTRKRLLKDRNQRKMLTRTRIWRYGLRNFTRNAWLTIAATAIMTITLITILATVVASLLLSDTIEAQKQKMDISIYFKSNTPQDTLENLAGRIRVVPNVTNVEISTSDQEYTKALDQFKHSDSLMEGVQLAVSEGSELPISAVIHVKMTDVKYRVAIDELIKNDAQFKKWVDQERQAADNAKIRENTINKLANVMNFAQKIGFGAAAIFIVISILVVFNTIRMAIFSRREEIDMMKLIGADGKFIRGPFLIEAQLYGAIAAIIAVALTYVAILKIFPSIGRYIEISGTREFMIGWVVVIFLATIVIGMAIGHFSARLAVRRYLKN